MEKTLAHLKTAFAGESHNDPLSSRLDQPDIARILFHPRQEPATPLPPGALDHDFMTTDNVRIGGRFYLAAGDGPHILFFHGNGETIYDYDPIGPQYAERGVSFLAVDYRGYGRSTGAPSVSAMLDDARLILLQTKEWLATNNRTGPLLVMGRSLGSACAVEVAQACQAEVAGLIIESGFADTLPLLETLGVDVKKLGLTEVDGFHNARKIALITKPTLIIHAQHDEIIPLSSAGILHAESGAHSKEFQVVPGAGHNTIIERTGALYFDVMKRFALRLAGKRTKRSSRAKG